MTLIDGPESLIESLPLIMIFPFFSDNIQTLQNIDHIIDPTSLNTKLLRDFIKLNDIITFPLKMFNELFWQFFKRFSFPIVSKYPVVHQGWSVFLKLKLVGLECLEVHLGLEDKDRKTIGDKGLKMVVELNVIVKEGVLR